MISVIAEDLGRHLQQQISDVIRRQIAIATPMVSTADIAVMLAGAAVSVTLTAAASIASVASERGNEGELFDSALASIAELASLDRERSLGLIREQRARNASV